MKVGKGMVLLVLCFSLLLSSGCFGTSKIRDNEVDSTYRLLYSSEVSTLNYLITSSSHEIRIGANVIDTLVEYDSFGNVIPSLATSWKTSEDGLSITFELRKGEYWVNEKGEKIAEVTAKDFVSAMQYVLTKEYESETAKLLFGLIKNAKDYYESQGDFERVGVKAYGNYTLVYTLEQPCPYFLSYLTYGCFMPAYGPLLEERKGQFGAATGTDTLYYNGAYVLSVFKPQEKRTFQKNESNWDADRVYIEKIEETYNSEATTLAPALALRGEIDYAAIHSDLLDTFMKQENTKDLVTRGRKKTDYSYFYIFNFNPKFDKRYEPENWNKAVQNENFRLAIMSAMDRVKALRVVEPNHPEELLLNTITPPNFVSFEGKDYTEFQALNDISKRDSFKKDMAVIYKEKAMSELKESGCTFPVKILLRYRANSTDWANECIVLAQQIEGLLGKDFIKFVVEAGPSQNFTSQVRERGDYAMLKANWGADYADPQTFTEVFDQHSATNYLPLRGEKLTIMPVIDIYYDLLSKAKESVLDIKERYIAYANAEAYLIKHALVIPFSMSPVSYQMTKLNTYESSYASFGVSTSRYKGMKYYKVILNNRIMEINKAVWEKEKKTKERLVR
nr:peptide ABC transporter substrate-binding protein [uncultured Lachnoclostridium sp.]